MGEKGSLKNKIKDFFKIRTKILKKRKKEELELKKKLEQDKIKNRKKVYSRPRIIFTIIGGYILTSIGYLITKKRLSNKDIYIKLKEIEIKIEKSNQEIELSQLKKEVYIIQNESIKNKKIDFKLDKELNRVVEKIEVKKKQVKKVDLVEPVIEKNVGKDFKNIEYKKGSLKNALEDILKNIDKVTDINDLDKINQKIAFYNPNEEERKIIGVIKVKIAERKSIFNKPIKDNLEKNIEIKKSNENSNYLENKKFLPILIMTGAMSAHVIGKISKEVINSIRFETNEIENKDKKEELEEKLEDNKLEEVETLNYNEKDDINNITDNNLDKNDVTREVINEKISLDKFYVDIIEIKKAHDIVKEELLKEKIELEELQIKLSKIEPKNRKKSFLNLMSKRIIDFSLSLTPLAIFKNKLVGGILGSVILNHRIKNTRKINQKVDINFYFDIKYILKTIVDKKDMLKKTISININSISEINNLKKDILKEIDYDFDKYPEVFNIINSLNLEEEKLKEKNEELKKELEKTKELEKKGKVKIKQISNLN